VAVAIALGIPSVVSIWYTIGTVIVPGLLIPVVTSYFDTLRPSPRWALAIMVGGFSASLLSLVFGHITAVNGTPQYFLGIEPMYPGLVLSMVLWMGERIYKRLLHRR
jgi:solute:Na+ symporter, SSS family